VWDVVEHFLMDKNILVYSKQSVIEKKQVANSFSRAAKSYDEVASLQRRVGESLCQFIPVSCVNKNAVEVVVDLGCGTGFFTPKLSSIFPDAQLLGVDLAEGMVNHAKVTRKLAAAKWLCGDAESLPLASDSVDIVFSSLSIQWCENNTALFAEVFRVLKPGGVFLFSTLGPETLFELKQAWQAVDDFVHVNKFVACDVLAQAASDTGFSLDADPSWWQQENITLEFESLKKLTHELKSLGAHNVNTGRPQGLTGRQRIQGLINAYDQQRNANGMLPASYQVFYGRLVKPSDVSISECEGVVCG
jgi:malonyl-CoA O-methyltransferase